MRILKIVVAVLLTVLAVTAGFLAVAVLALGVGAFLLGRWARRRLTGASRPTLRPRRAANRDVIDVTAREVPPAAPPLEK